MSIFDFIDIFDAKTWIRVEKHDDSETATILFNGTILDFFIENFEVEYTVKRAFVVSGVVVIVIEGLK